MNELTELDKYHYVLRKLQEIEDRIYYWDIEDGCIAIYRTREDYHRLNCYYYTVERCYTLIKNRERKDKISKII